MTGLNFVTPGQGRVFGDSTVRKVLTQGEGEVLWCSRWGEENRHALAFWVRVRVGKREKVTRLAREIA